MRRARARLVMMAFAVGAGGVLFARGAPAQSDHLERPRTIPDAPAGRRPADLAEGRTLQQDLSERLVLLERNPRDGALQETVLSLAHDVLVSYDKLKQEQAVLREERGAFLQEIATLKQANAALRQSLARLTEDRERAQAEMTALTEANARLKAAAADLAKTGACLDVMVRALTRNLRAAERTAGRLAEENAWLTQHAGPPPASVQLGWAALYRELGAAYTKAQLFDHAIDAYQRALELDPRDPQAHYCLGLLYRHARSDTALSVAHFEQYLALSRDLDSRQRNDVEYLVQMLKGGTDGKPAPAR